jgi:hypothetical protein
MRSPPDKRERRPDQPTLRNTLTAAKTKKVSDIVPDSPGGVVVDLDGYRARRLLADLGLAPTVPVPCGPCCRCYGVPLGQGCGP